MLARNQPPITAQRLTLGRAAPWVLVVFVLAIPACILWIAIGAQTARENALVGVLLAVASILATWLVAHVYANQEHQRAIEDVQVFHRSNLRMYALKAAEKVNNFSNELGRLAAYLEEELEDEPDQESTSTALHARNERLWSAVHIIHTLKSVNDTALSDWRGVIGDELQEQRQAQLEREENVQEHVARLEALIEQRLTLHDPSAEDSRRLSADITLLRRELRLALRNSTQLALFSRPIPAKKHHVSLPCPVCTRPVSYEQKAKRGSMKQVTCSECGAQLFSIWEPPQGYRLAARRVLLEVVLCPSCGRTTHAQLDSFPGSRASITCDSCGTLFKVHRTRTSFRISHVPQSPAAESPAPLAPELLMAVKSSLPPQPWPIGIHREVAAKLDIGPGIAWQAIGELIRQGVFSPQNEGKVIQPEPSSGEPVGSS